VKRAAGCSKSFPSRATKNFAGQASVTSRTAPSHAHLFGRSGTKGVRARGETRKKLASEFLIVFRAMHKCKASAEHPARAQDSPWRFDFAEKKMAVKAKEDCREDFGRSNGQAGAAPARRVRKLGFTV
jgi:hypothetical protein